MKQIYLLFILILTNHFLVLSQRINVLSETDLTPINNVTIYTPDFSISTLTNKNGNADISNFLGKEFIIFQHPSYQTVTLSYKLIKSNNYEVLLSERTIKLSEITISANKWKQESIEIPNKIISIQAKDISFNNPQTSADVLSNSHEIFIQKSQLGGGSPMIRGFAANRLLIEVDGIRMNNIIFRSGNLQNIILIDPNSLSGSEVILGPGTVIDGSDAIGGVMNFQTKSVTLSENDTANIKLNGFIRYSTANNEETSNFIFNYGRKKWGLLIVASHSSFGDLRTGANRSSKYPDWGKRPEYVQLIDGHDSIVENTNVNIQKFSGYSQNNFLQKLKWEITKNISLDYSLFYSNSSNIPRYDRLIQYKDDKLKYAQWEYGPQFWLLHNLNIKLNKSHKLYNQMLISLSYQDIEESRIDRKLNSENKRIRIEKVKAYSLNIDFEKELSENNTFFYGIEGILNFENSSAEKINIFTDETTICDTRYPDGGTKFQSGAAYLNYKLKLNNFLRFQTRIRYSRINLNSKFNTNPYNFPFSDIRINTGALNGSFGFVYTPKQDIFLNLNLGSGFRAPNLDDIAKVFDSEPEHVVVPNENLKSEYAYNSDLTIEKIFNKSAKLNITFFYTYLDNAMVRRDFTLNGQDSIMYDGVLSKVEAVVNAGYATVYGASIAFSADIDKHFATKANISYSTGKDDEQYPLRHIPPVFGNLTLIYKAERFKSEIYSNFNANKPWDKLPPSEQAKTHLYTADGTPAWITLNVKASYQINKYIQANVGIENIFDTHYRPYSSGISAPGRNLIIAIRANL